MLIKFDAAQKIFESRVIANGIKEGMHFERLQNRFALLVCSIKPNKRLIIVRKSEVQINEEVAWT